MFGVHKLDFFSFCFFILPHATYSWTVSLIGSLAGYLRKWSLMWQLQSTRQMLATMKTCIWECIVFVCWKIKSIGVITSTQANTLSIQKKCTNSTNG